jgi:tRNA/tmRNA/rRNA uracil-C5-methylase (TrmA/RlmC/RlmD family)
MSDSKAHISPCLHFGKCAGCSENLSLNPPLVWKEVLSFFLPYNIHPHLHQKSPLHWRYRAKMAVRGTTAQPLIGLFKRFSHQVFPIPSCLVHHPHLNQAFEMIRLWIRQHSLVPYEEGIGRGELRYLQGVVQKQTGRVQLTFVLNSKKDSPQARQWHTLVQQLGEHHPSFWHSLWINFNDQPTNTIFGLEWSYVWGEEYLWEQFGDVSVCYGPASFGQANLSLFELMLIRIRELLLEQACVAEFYAGVGVIGLVIASRCQWVQCSEVNPHAEAYFNQARARLPSSLASRVTFFSGATQKAFSLLDGATSVIVDPPRKGLDPHFFSALKKAITVRQLLYISCGWDAFKQDCQKLCADGWKIQHVDGYLFFPGSNHVELLVCFEKN